MSTKKQSSREPLAHRMRPRDFDEYIGHTTLTSPSSTLRTMIERGKVPPMILWGPPGVGKTSLAHVIADVAGIPTITLSAVESGKRDLMQVIEKAEKTYGEKGTQTILFIDEIHRWNKAQQDALLPYVERGTIILIGATTENPSFEIIRPLLSRTRVYVLTPHTTEDIVTIITRALQDPIHGMGQNPPTINNEVIAYLAELSQGDARIALNTLELAHDSLTHTKGKPDKKLHITEEHIREAIQRVSMIFDKKGEEFYNLISALHKSMRGSDPSASIYWLARMIEGGADPLYVARRIVRFASEDIGMANSEALIQAMSAYHACERLGMPECAVHLTQAVVYCAKSKKSNALYRAYTQASADARTTSHLSVPLHLRNASTKLMKDIGYGKGYQYNPDIDGDVDQTYLPPELISKDYFKK